jgi:hypothetical protein
MEQNEGMERKPLLGAVRVLPALVVLNCPHTAMSGTPLPDVQRPGSADCAVEHPLRPPTSGPRPRQAHGARSVGNPLRRVSSRTGELKLLGKCIPVDEKLKPESKSNDILCVECYPDKVRRRHVRGSSLLRRSVNLWQTLERL